MSQPIQGAVYHLDGLRLRADFIEDFGPRGAWEFLEVNGDRRLAGGYDVYGCWDGLLYEMDDHGDICCVGEFGNLALVQK